MDERLVANLIDAVGGKFSSELGIDLSAVAPSETFRWFLAAKLFAARISTSIAVRTWREFERRGVMTPERILATGWDGLVEILDAGGYVRYDFSTATKLLAIMADLERLYGSDLNRLHGEARDGADLERRLKLLGKGIGDVTVNIFLRELRTVWPKARPDLSPLARLAAGHLGLVREGEEPLPALERLWSRHRVEGRDFRDLEAALVRLGKDFCKKGRHEACPMRGICGQKRR